MIEYAFLVVLNSPHSVRKLLSSPWSYQCLIMLLSPFYSTFYFSHQPLSHGGMGGGTLLLVQAVGSHSLGLIEISVVCIFRRNLNNRSTLPTMNLRLSYPCRLCSQLVCGKAYCSNCSSALGLVSNFEFA